MIINRNILLLVGSVKLPHSTSESLGTYLIDSLNKKGLTTQTLFIHKMIHSSRQAALLESINKADVVVLAFPLYFDSPPHLVTKLMEIIAQSDSSIGENKKQSLICIINCGLPEVDHIKPAMSICHKFADETGFYWDGGLALGGGEAVNGVNLSDVKSMARNIIKSLDLTADAIAEGSVVQQKAIEIMARPIAPFRMYTIFGAIRFLWGAMKYGMLRSVKAQPFQ